MKSLRKSSWVQCTIYSLEKKSLPLYFSIPCRDRMIQNYIKSIAKRRLGRFISQRTFSDFDIARTNTFLQRWFLATLFWVLQIYDPNQSQNVNTDLWLVRIAFLISEVLYQGYAQVHQNNSVFEVLETGLSFLHIKRKANWWNMQMPWFSLQSRFMFNAKLGIPFLMCHFQNQRSDYNLIPGFIITVSLCVARKMTNRHLLLPGFNRNFNSNFCLKA